MTVELAVAEREALVSALVRLKFNEGEVPEPYFGSPLVGEALLKLLASVIAESEETGDLERARRWRSWQDWSVREYERQIVVKHAASVQSWASWTAGERRGFLRHCAAPFALSDVAVDDLIADVESVRSASMRNQTCRRGSTS